MKKLIIPLLLATALLSGCHRVTVRHQAHVPPPVQVVEHRHVFNRELVVHRHQGGGQGHHRHAQYSHHGPSRVVVVKPRPVIKPRVTSRPHSGYVAPPPPRRTHGHAPRPRVTERIIRHRSNSRPAQRESSWERPKSARSQEHYRQRKVARDTPPRNHGDAKGRTNKDRGNNGRGDKAKANKGKANKANRNKQADNKKTKKNDNKSDKDRQKKEKRKER